jgi:hypothetical protein
MKWYSIYFNSQAISYGADKNLVKEFLFLMHNNNLPVGLALYTNIEKLDEGFNYYVSSPDSCDTSVKKILSNYPCFEVTVRNMNNLSFISGKSL